MNEAETRAEYIDPALKAVGWGVVEGSKILREYPITPGGIEAHGCRAGGVEEVAVAPSLHRPPLMHLPSAICDRCQSLQSVSAFLPPIPTGLHPSAQGCAPRATLGHGPQRFLQPHWGCITASPTDRCNPVGVDDILPGSPRVASRTRQPWADGRYPVGVNQLAESRQLVTNCHRLKAGCRSVNQLVTNCNQLRTVCIFITQQATNCYQLNPPTMPGNLIPLP